MDERHKLHIDALDGYPPEIGRALWRLEDARRRTLEWLVGIDVSFIDQTPLHGQANSIGTLLYHITAIEADWLYAEVLGQDFPPEVDALLSYPVRDEAGRLAVVAGVDLHTHLRRLERIRTCLLDGFQGMALEEFSRPRALENYDVTPEWVLHHLAQHESQHRGEMMTVYALAHA
jgi:uncharacterized damage-inducible protein DinB